MFKLISLGHYLHVLGHLEHWTVARHYVVSLEDHFIPVLLLYLWILTPCSVPPQGWITNVLLALKEVTCVVKLVSLESLLLWTIC